MIPSIVASQIKQGIEDFVLSSFPVTTAGMTGLFDNLLENLINRQGNFFNDPYITIDLPFRRGKQDKQYFESINLNFKPYKHQEIAFERLTNQKQLSTIIATGTGSGKTECFLYPVLDYCYQHKDLPGIKAIIIYPMNALAYDQSKRIAKTIWNCAELKNNLSVGLYIGESENNPKSVMSAESVITDRDTMRQNPPDILLTNYKMLDYLLLRPQDKDLWSSNSANTLKFLIVDELHTFDGAQGTDLACLIRRLKARLNVPENFLCCIGTSATLGGNSEFSSITKYASDIFGEDFSNDSVIIEDRLTCGEFLEKHFVKEYNVVAPENVNELNSNNYDNFDKYLFAQYKLWFNDINNEGLEEPKSLTQAWCINLKSKLINHPFFQNLLKATNGRTVSKQAIIDELILRMGLNPDESNEYYSYLLDSMLALISTAKDQVPEEASNENETLSTARELKTVPFLNVRVQLWLRELKRMVANVAVNPKLCFYDDLNEFERKTCLPVIHCNQCGSTGWLGTFKTNSSIIDNYLRTIYTSFFAADDNFCLMYPIGKVDNELQANTNSNLSIANANAKICADCLKVFFNNSNEILDKCDNCGFEAKDKNFIDIYIVNNINKNSQKKLINKDCHFCGNKNGLMIVGSQAASLAGVLTSSLFASTWNKDKKFIAFSDSVQDAAHKAGFIGSRSFGITLRQGIQKALQNVDDNIPLIKVADVFIDYWQNKIGLSQAMMIARFLPRDLEWLDDYKDLKENKDLPENSLLADYFMKRLNWEIFAEFSFKSRIGRTLEKSCARIAYIDRDFFDKALPVLYETLTNEIEVFKKIPITLVKIYLVGILNHLKAIGAITLSPVLDYFMSNSGNYYVLNKQQFLPNFGANSRLPCFLTNDNASKNFECINNCLNNRFSWSINWLIRCFQEYDFTITNLANDILITTLNVLSRVNIIEEKPTKDKHKIWGLKPDVLMVSQNVVRVCCNMCLHEVCLSTIEITDWENMFCFRKNCIGKYIIKNTPVKDYYYNLYSYGDVVKVVPVEHTSLLERNTREDIEYRFINSQNSMPWDPNVLSATSTLEMGIDIGDLSSVVLCSVPPTQANYLQRIGRSGRKNGNSLAVTLANGKPHDLFFFTDPIEMINGIVNTPGVFLDASAILQRQFTAFTFDKWVDSDIQTNDFPNKLATVLNNVASTNNHKEAKVNIFPYNWINFVNSNQDDLFNSFLQLFFNRLSATTIEEIKDFLFNQEYNLTLKVLTGLTELAEERQSLKHSLNTLKKKIKEKIIEIAKSNNHAQELADLDQEKRNLQEIIKTINNKETLNFFTDEGFIPNYSFPEAGVTLKSVIYRKRNKNKLKNSNKAYDTWSYKYERPSSSAISELAPANFFYAEGRKVRIDQVNMEISPVEEWRLCKNCSYTKLILQEEYQSENCPRCADPQWLDLGQRKKMLKLRQVIATTSDKDSRIGDESDDRTPKYFNKQFLVDFNDDTCQNTYLIKDEDITFGFEYHNKSIFREINSGEKQNSAEQVTIAGITSNRHGFRICQYCGKVQLPGTNDVTAQHSFICKSRKPDSEKNFEDIFYLYREFSSEAIGILLPSLTDTTDLNNLANLNSLKTSHSLIAALLLGLKLKFKGKVDHLKVTFYDEPIPDNYFRKNYLVLYDTVPGGTGYLKQLVTSQDPSFLEVLELAFNCLKACKCNNVADKDGCYQCLFAYKNSYDMPYTSRNLAIDLIGKILSLKHTLKKSEPLAKIKVEGLLESELEARFIDELKKIILKQNFQNQNSQAQFHKELVNNKPGYFIKLDNGTAYYIEPQVLLKETEGIQIPSKADFIFWPINSGNKNINCKPIVVFLDGFEYHKDRIGIDMLQRIALTRSDKFIVWSLSWNDIEKNTKTDYYSIFQDLMPSNVFNQFISTYNIEEFKHLNNYNSFTLFIELLKNPNWNQWQKYALLTVLKISCGKSKKSENNSEQFKNNFTLALPVELNEIIASIENPHLNRTLNYPEHSTEIEFSFFINANLPNSIINKPINNDVNQIIITSILDDTIDEETLLKNWNGYLRYYNIFQFIPNCFFLTKSLLIKNQYHHIDSSRLADVSFSGNEDWQALYSLTCPELHKIIDIAFERNFDLPIVGYELTQASGEVIAYCELAFYYDHINIAVLSSNELENGLNFRDRFKSLNWQVYSANEFIAKFGN